MSKRGALPVSALLLLVCALPARAKSGAEQLVAETENALWDDHVDVRDPCFLLARDGIPPEDLVEALKGVAYRGHEPEELRARARRLLRRLAPDGRSLCRYGEGRAAPPPTWRPPR